MTPASRPRLILVHGAWVGPWEFAPLLALLRERGWSVTAVGLPSIASQRGIEDDAAAVTAAIDAQPGPVILVGHSYGGVPVTLAGDHPRVAHLVYVCAFALDIGESLQGSMGGELPEWWGIQDGQVTMGRSREERVAMIAADLPPEAAHVAEGLADLFLPQSYRSLTQPLTRTAWRTRPTTYVLGEKDGVVSPELQERLAARTGGVTMRLPRGHTPFQEDPHGFADLLERVALGTIAAR